MVDYVLKGETGYFKTTMVPPVAPEQHLQRAQPPEAAEPQPAPTEPPQE